jgi:hypothetical protein
MEIDMTDPYKFKRRHRTTVSTMLMLAIADKVQADLMVRKPDEVQTRRVSVAELQFTPPSDRVLCWVSDLQDCRHRRRRVGQRAGAPRTAAK